MTDIYFKNEFDKQKEKELYEKVGEAAGKAYVAAEQKVNEVKDLAKEAKEAPPEDFTGDHNGKPHDDGKPLSEHIKAGMDHLKEGVHEAYHHTMADYAKTSGNEEEYLKEKGKEKIAQEKKESGEPQKGLLESTVDTTKQYANDAKEFIQEKATNIKEAVVGKNPPVEDKPMKDLGKNQDKELEKTKI